MIHLAQFQMRGKNDDDDDDDDDDDGDDDLVPLSQFQRKHQQHFVKTQVFPI